MSNIKKFETENRGIITQLIFDKDTNLPMLKLIVLLSSTRKDEATGKYYKNKYFNLRNIAEMIDCPVSTTITAMQKLIKKNVVVHKDQYYFLNQGIQIEVDPKMDQENDIDQDLDQADQKMDQDDQDSDQTRSGFGSYNNKKYNNLKNNKKVNIPENKNQDLELKLLNDFDKFSPEYKERLLTTFKTKENVINFQLGFHTYADDILEKAKPIIFEPEFKSESQDVEASYTQNGNSVECSFKIKPKQELEQATQTPRLPAIKSTESNLEALAPDRIPNLLPKCEYFKISDHNKKLVREWFKENGMTDDHIKLAVREVELWLKNAKKGSKAFKARKVTGQSDHHLYLYSAWVQENLAKRFKASASMQQVGKVNVEAELYQEAIELGMKPTNSRLTFSEQEELREKRAIKNFLGNDNKEIE